MTHRLSAVAALAILLSPIQPAQGDSNEKAFNFIQTVTLKDDWSIRELRNIATQLTTLQGRGTTEVAMIRFPSAGSLVIRLDVYSEGKPKQADENKAPEPAGAWVITLKKVKDSWVYEKHDWADV